MYEKVFSEHQTHPYGIESIEDEQVLDCFWYATEAERDAEFLELKGE